MKEWRGRLFDRIWTSVWLLNSRHSSIDNDQRQEREGIGRRIFTRKTTVIGCLAVRLSACLYVCLFICLCLSVSICLCLPVCLGNVCMYLSESESVSVCCLWIGMFGICQQGRMPGNGEIERWDRRWWKRTMSEEIGMLREEDAGSGEAVDGEDEAGGWGEGVLSISQTGTPSVQHQTRLHS